MSRETTLIVLGVLIALSPFIGLPLSWRAVLVPVLGALIILIGITLRAKKLSPSAPAPEVLSPEQASAV